jgi:hypothetical protein
MATSSAPDADRDAALQLLQSLSAQSRAAPLKALFRVLEARQAEASRKDDGRMLEVWHARRPLGSRWC